MKLWLWVLLAAVLVGIILILPIRSNAQLPSITLDWTSPGDDGNVGTASTYEMRWSATRPDTTSTSTMDAWWGGATSISNLPTPLVAGTQQSVTVTPTGGFAAGSTIYFVMKACDEVPNCSPYSNVASKPVPDAMPPSRIIDLIAR